MSGTTGSCRASRTPRSAATRSASCEHGLCAGLGGRVVEIGFGSGLNVRFYPPAVTGVSAVEPSDVAWRLSAPRRERSAVPVERSGSTASTSRSRTPRTTRRW